MSMQGRGMESQRARKEENLLVVKEALQLLERHITYVSMLKKKTKIAFFFSLYNIRYEYKI